MSKFVSSVYQALCARSYLRTGFKSTWKTVVNAPRESGREYEYEIGRCRAMGDDPGIG